MKFGDMRFLKDSSNICSTLQYITATKMLHPQTFYNVLLFCCLTTIMIHICRTERTQETTVCIIKNGSLSSSMTPAESVATSNDCPHESPQTMSYGKLLQKDCDSHGCGENPNTKLEIP